MRILGRIFLALAVVVLLAIAGIYADGAILPVNHTVSVTGVVAAPPEKVFARITDIAAGASWRPAVKSVSVLQPDHGRDLWVEYLAHDQTMTFLATRTDAPVRREVQLDDPSAPYGGTWTYELSPGPTPDTTTLKITESGFIRAPLYRFMMVHVIGPASNLNQYMHDIEAAAKR